VLHYPAFLFAGVRQTIAGIILISLALAKSRTADISFRNIRRQMLIGFLMLTLGNGCVTWGEREVPSGVAALICSLMPLFAVIINLLSSRKEHFNIIIALGLLLGTCGVALVFMHDLKQLSNPAYLLGMGSVLLATMSWAGGSMINRGHTNPVNPFFNSGLQLLFGGLFMLIISPAVDDLHHFELWNTEGILALLYLIIFGSVIAYAAYMYSLSKLPVGIATLYAYINPMVAVLVGHFLMNEELNLFTAFAFIAIVCSVFLVNRGYKISHAKAAELSVEELAVDRATGSLEESLG
jgi:drug/metabolite transporter (DMT)-like permease